jgi:hypothetical protein
MTLLVDVSQHFLPRHSVLFLLFHLLLVVVHVICKQELVVIIVGIHSRFVFLYDEAISSQRTGCRSGFTTAFG